MCCSRVIYKLLFLPLVCLPLILEGCAVFSAVGDAISGGYENTVTYFNLYYNARTAFTNAEAQIAAAQKASRGKPAPVGQQQQSVPAEAQKNLDLVIDKCSNILAYHSSSSLVDDALMMIGKAFFYRGEYSKAERKFQELMTQYPGSSWVTEAQLWYARSENALGQYDGARKNAEALTGLLNDQGENDILANAYALIATLDIHDNTVVPAIEAYLNEIKAANSNNLRGEGYAAVAQLYFNDGQYQQSIDASLKVEEYSDDNYLIFKSKLLASDAYRHLQQNDKALALTNEMAEDYRFNDFMGSVYLERANIMYETGHPADAFALYRKVDTTYARTEAGAKADVRLAKYYEESGDYVKVREYYTRASGVPGVSPDVDLGRKIGAINSYFAFKKELQVADSILAMKSNADSSRLAIGDRQHAPNDSVWTADSIRIALQMARDSVVVDTLMNAKSRAAAGLGELFYTDLANPDSAIAWLKFALSQKYDASNAPRILFILSELATTYPDKSSVTSQQYRDKLLKDFPESYFAKQLRNDPAIQDSRDATADSAASAYTSAESMIDSGRNSEAIAALQRIVRKYPSTTVAAKSQYAIGWLYENRLSNMDSAIVQYKLLSAQYPSTTYAVALRGRMLDTLSASPAKTDSTSKILRSDVQKQDTARVRQTGILPTAQKPGAPLSRRAKILQSMNQRRDER